MIQGVSRKELSVIMPALNEEANISSAIDRTLRAFDDFKTDGEIVIINDGSTDRTQQIIEQKFAENPGRICLIQHSAPRGIGASFWEGVDCAQAEVVVMLPGDDENIPSESLRYFRLLEHVDIVIPFLYNKETRPLVRNALSFLYRFIVNTTFLVNFNYTNGTVFYRKAILQELPVRSSGFFFQTDILVRCVRRGYLFAEVPYRVDIRACGVSKAVSFPSFLQVVRGYLRLVRDCYFHKAPKEELFARGSQTAQRRDGH